MGPLWGWAYLRERGERPAEAAGSGLRLLCALLLRATLALGDSGTAATGSGGGMRRKACGAACLLEQDSHGFSFDSDLAELPKFLEAWAHTGTCPEAKARTISACV